jgi:hypothetical protein
MGQSAHPGRRSGWAGAFTTTLALAAGVGLVGCSPSSAAATTVLRGVIGTTVIHADGTTTGGVSGLHVHPGDVVRTAVGGRAELVTRGRVVYVGSQAALQVLDGVHQQLRHGAVVVDAQRGPGLDLQVAGLDVSAPAGAAVRAERSVMVRVGALAGRADVASGTGRTLTVSALHQAMVSGDALPDDTTPLQLTDDDGEAHAVPDLVRDDQTLIGLARGLDSVGGSTAAVVSASWHGVLTPAPRGAGRSERLLPAIIAAAGSRAGVDDRYHRAVDLRQAGGSWGVVARLVGVRASGAVAALAAFERTQPPGQVGSVAAVLAVAGGGAGGTGRGANGGGTGGLGHGGPGTGGGTGTGGGGGGGSPTPTPSPGPAAGLLRTVDNTVGQVLSILPTPIPTPSHSALPGPAITLPGLSIQP